LLSEGESSRLYRSLVDEQQKALTLAAFPMEMEDPGIVLTFALPNIGVDPKDLETAMDAEISKVQNELISDNELQKLKNQTEKDFVNGNASIATRATNLCNYYTYYKNTSKINTEMDNYMNVTKEDILRVAKKYFTKDNRIVLYYLPKKS
jgi:predicted Zn-dependent peptidase